MHHKYIEDGILQVLGAKEPLYKGDKDLVGESSSTFSSHKSKAQDSMSRLKEVFRRHGFLKQHSTSHHAHDNGYPTYKNSCVNFPDKRFHQAFNKDVKEANCDGASDQPDSDNESNSDHDEDCKDFNRNRSHAEPQNDDVQAWTDNSQETKASSNSTKTTDEETSENGIDHHDSYDHAKDQQTEKSSDETDQNTDSDLHLYRTGSAQRARMEAQSELSLIDKEIAGLRGSLQSLLRTANAIDYCNV